jgi:hypothetical protein
MSTDAKALQQEQTTRQNIAYKNIAIAALSILSSISAACTSDK